MKKITISMLIIGFLAFSTQVFAQVVTTSRKLNKPSQRVEQKQPTGYTKTAGQKASQSKTLETKIKNCTPYSEKKTFDMGGVDFLFNIKISGWVNNKCQLDFTADFGGINSMFENLYGVNASDTQVFAFAPQIKCAFTQAQLNKVGDAILQEEERQAGKNNNMLKSPSEIDIMQFLTPTSSDSELMNILLKENACQILNTKNSEQMFNSIFTF